MVEKNGAVQAELFDNPVAARLCRECGKPAVIAHLLCIDHKREYNRQKATERRQANRERGVCCLCAGPLDLMSKAKCAQCRARRQKAWERERAEKEAASSEGKCFKCGKAAAHPTGECSACYDARASRRATRNADSIRRKKIRVKYGLCVTCSKPNDRDNTQCLGCARRRQRNASRIRMEKREAGICTQCSRPAVSAGDASLCRYHWFRGLATRLSLAGQARTAMAQQLEELWESQGGRCAYTGTPLEMGVNASVDHKQPKSRGGSNDIDNLQFTTLAINYAKRNANHAEFLAICASVVNHQPLNIDAEFSRFLHKSKKLAKHRRRGVRSTPRGLSAGT